jgi:hypothetical protein
VSFATLFERVQLNHIVRRFVVSTDCLFGPLFSQNVLGSLTKWFRNRASMLEGLFFWVAISKNAILWNFAIPKKSLF